MKNMKQANGAIAAVGTTALVAAPGAAYRIHLVRGVIGITTHHDTGIITITDGTTNFISFVAKSGNGSLFPFDFGDDGVYCAKNTALNLVNTTNNVGATATIKYWVG